MRIVILGLLGLVCVGCQTVESSLNYTKGSQALEAGDYDTAITKLEKAVQIDPKVARNHINLAAAYLVRGQIQEGWPHARKGVMLAPRDTVAQTNFRHYFKSLIDRGLVREGASEAEIAKNLGQPDSAMDQGDKVSWQYGMVALFFKEGRVIGFGDMEFKRMRR